MVQSKITLSDGSEVEIRLINWKGYKAIKSLIARVVSGPVLTEVTTFITGPVSGILGDLLTGIQQALKPGEEGLSAQAALASDVATKWNDANTANLILAAIDQLKSSIGNIVTELFDRSDEFTEMLLIAGSDLDPKKLNDLAFEDLARVRDAVLDVNDLGKLLDLEKNWLGRVMTAGRGLTGSPTSNSPGTSTTSIN